MSGFKRFCMVVYSLAGIFLFAALALTWFGPWTAVASALLNVEGYVIALAVCALIVTVGFLVILIRALSGRKVRVIEVATVDGGVISVSKDAIASQAAHIVEADGSCTAARVRVDAKARGHVRVHIRVLPHETVDVVVKGAELHTELLDGLAAVCGDKVEDVSLEFVEPEAVTVAPREATYAPATYEPAPASEPEPAPEPEPEPTSEITVPISAVAPAPAANEEV